MIPEPLTSGLQLVLGGSDPLHHNYDYPILSLENGFAILTNHMLMMIVVFGLMMWLLPRAARSIATGKTGTSHDYVTKDTFAHLIEVLCVFFRNDVAKPVLGKNTDKFMPFIWTVFFFILFNNLLGMVPLLDATSLLFDGMINGSHDTVAHVETDSHAGGGPATLDAGHGDASHEAPEVDAHGAPAGEASHTAENGAAHADSHAMKLGPFVLFQDLTKKETASHFHGIGGTATGNIAVTCALALIAIVVVIGSGISALGIGGFLHHLTLGAPVALWPLTILLEIIGLMAKPFALMVRLFANMTAGHVMLSALLGFCSMAWNGVGPFGGVLISVPSIIFATLIGLLELLVAFIQAFVFAFLTTMFISMFQHHDHDHEHEHGHGHDHKHTPDFAEMGVTPQLSLET